MENQEKKMRTCQCISAGSCEKCSEPDTPGSLNVEDPSESGRIVELHACACSTPSKRFGHRGCYRTEALAERGRELECGEKNDVTERKKMQLFTDRYPTRGALRIDDV